MRECPACAELASEDGRLGRALGAADVAPAPPDVDFDAVLGAALRGDDSLRGRLRSMSTPARIVVGCVTTLLVGTLFLVVWPRSDLALYPTGRMALVVGLLAAATVTAVALAFPRLHRARPSRGRLLAILVALLTVGFVPALLPPPHAPTSSGSFWAGITPCLGLGTLAAIPAFVMLRALRRHDGLTGWSPLFLAAAAAMGGHLALQTHCPVVDRAHILASHSVLGLVYVLIAAVLVRLAAARA